MTRIRKRVRGGEVECVLFVCSCELHGIQLACAVLCSAFL